jgi:hypothetical protein
MTDHSIIEGEFRVIATRKIRPSPNRQRAVARIVFWNAVLFGAVVLLPFAR